MLKIIQRENDEYVLADDNKYYKNPVLGLANGHWFMDFIEDTPYIHSMHHNKRQTIKTKIENILKLLNLEGAFIDCWQAGKITFPTGVKAYAMRVKLEILSNYIPADFIIKNEGSYETV